MFASKLRHIDTSAASYKVRFIQISSHNFQHNWPYFAKNIMLFFNWCIVGTFLVYTFDFTTLQKNKSLRIKFDRVCQVTISLLHKMLPKVWSNKWLVSCAIRWSILKTSCQKVEERLTVTLPPNYVSLENFFFWTLKFSIASAELWIFTDVSHMRSAL